MVSPVDTVDDGEGERDADAVNHCRIPGMVGVTNAGGGGKWKGHHSGAVAEAVPDLGEEPAERAAGSVEPFEEFGGAAEAGGIPEEETAALGFDERVGGGGVGDVFLVGGVADVTAEECAGKSRLAHIGVGDET